MSDVPPTVDIVIVNWNSGELLRECVASIATASAGVGLRQVVIVDNASQDGSADGLSHAALPLILERNSVNRGFAAACNQGALRGSSDYLLFLNPDTRLFRGSLAVPLRMLSDPANSGVAVAGIQLVDEDGGIMRSCVRFPTARLWASWALGLDRVWPSAVPSFFLPLNAHRQSMDVDQVMGAFFLVRRRVWKELRGFDERFFVYFEELDFSLRVRRAGYRSRFVAEARALHHGEGTTRQIPASRLFYVLRSRILYGCKHYSPVANGGLLLTTLLLEPLTRLSRACLRGSRREAKATITAWVALWATLPATLRRARED